MECKSRGLAGSGEALSRQTLNTGALSQVFPPAIPSLCSPGWKPWCLVGVCLTVCLCLQGEGASWGGNVQKSLEDVSTRSSGERAGAWGKVDTVSDLRGSGAGPLGSLGKGRILSVASSPWALEEAGAPGSLGLQWWWAGGCQGTDSLAGRTRLGCRCRSEPCVCARLG